TSVGPCGGLITTTVKDSRDQEILVVPIIDDEALNNDRPNAFTELGTIAADARLFDEQLESIEDGVNESIGGRGAGVVGNVRPYLHEVLLGERGQPIGHLRFLGASRTTA